MNKILNTNKKCSKSSSKCSSYPLQPTQPKHEIDLIFRFCEVGGRAAKTFGKIKGYSHIKKALNQVVNAFHVHCSVHKKKNKLN
jgi:hypothetical protein